MLTRIYIANTYYQVYIAIIKELNFRKRDDFVKADLMLTDVTTDFKDLHQRVEKIGLFENVIDFHQPPHKELAPEEFAARGKGNEIQKLITRIKYSKKIIKEIEKYVDFDFTAYDEVYMFDDADPLGYYFYKHKLRYICVEDALNMYQRDMRSGERRFFWFRKILFNMGLLYLQGAVGKNAYRIEVNDKTGVTCVEREKLDEVPREALIEALTPEEKNLVYDVFEENGGEKEIPEGQKTALILAQRLYPEILSSLELQKQAYRKIIDELKDDYTIYLKPHPRDYLDYAEAFPEINILGKYYPVEILNLQNKLHFDLAVTITSTSIDGIKIADEKKIYGTEFTKQFE